MCIAIINNYNYKATHLVRTVPILTLNDKFAMHFCTLFQGIFYVNALGMQTTSSATVIVMKETLLY
jgi:hypothetical protein